MSSLLPKSYCSINQRLGSHIRSAHYMAAEQLQENRKPSPLGIEIKRLAGEPIPTVITGKLEKLPRNKTLLGSLRNSWAMRDITADPGTLMLTYGKDGEVKGSIGIHNLVVAHHDAAGGRFAFTVTGTNANGTNEETLILAAKDEVEGQRWMQDLKKFKDAAAIKEAHAALASYNAALKRWQNAVALDLEQSRTGAAAGGSAAPRGVRGGNGAVEVDDIIGMALKNAAKGKFESGAEGGIEQMKPKRNTKLTGASASRLGGPPPQPPAKLADDGGDGGRAEVVLAANGTLATTKVVTNEVAEVEVEDVCIAAKVLETEAKLSENAKRLEALRKEEELATKRADAVASGMIKAKKKGLFKEKVKQVMVANKVKKQLEDNMVGSIKQDRVKMMFEQGERTSGSAADIAARLAKKKAARGASKLIAAAAAAPPSAPASGAPKVEMDPQAIPTPLPLPIPPPPPL